MTERPTLGYMRRAMNRKFFAAIVLGGMLMLAPLSYNAAAISDEQKAAISENCTSVKTSLKMLQKADSRTRVFLGTSYEHILTNFISPLNIRLAKNNHPETTLSEIQIQFATKRNKFSDTFTQYMKALETLGNTDCTHDPENFYNNLEKTRAQRKELNQLSNDLRDLTIKNIETVNKLKDSL